VKHQRPVSLRLPLSARTCSSVALLTLYFSSFLIGHSRSHEQFITEHYWGYTARGEGTSEYRVEHPRWKIWPADSFELKADIATLYGEKFLEPLEAKPVSAFIADGSHVEVQRRTTGPEPGL
jgi:Uncharacterized conserved protein (COG2071)